jgi:hypothetical protein
MTRTLQDPELVLWEAYASSGDWGTPEHARIMFQCLTEPGRRARVLIREGDRSDVEEELARITDAELVELLAEAQELS